jgi:uncharacterized protein (TIGR03083 family)
VDHETNLAHIVEQSDALRAAAVAAGPAAAVPTCPKWTVHDLVTHIADVHTLVAAALLQTRDSSWPKVEDAPAEWDELLAYWDDIRATMLTRLAGDPVKPAWSFIPDSGSVGWWARRQAHEAAIHRLDAEHAAHESVPTLLFDSELAADGIDEVLTVMSTYRARARRPEVTVEGELLVHAADAGEVWLLKAHGGLVETGRVEDSGTDSDAILAGTADAVYRAVWKRPSTAILNGRAELLDAVNGG